MTKPNRMEAPYRELATVERVFVGKEDHGIDTVSLTMAGVGVAGSSWGQSFGNLCLGDPGDLAAFCRRLCLKLDVPNVQDLKGKRFYILRCFASLSSPIEGLEDPETGARFTITGFRRWRFPDKPEFHQSPLEERRQSLVRSIESHKRRILQDEQALYRLGDDYVSWEET